MADESIARPFYTVLILAFVCSALVAGAAVGLRPLQDANRDLDQKKHILYAAGLYDKNRTIEEMFAPIETRVVELVTGRFVAETTIRPESYKQLKAALSDETGRPLSIIEDRAKLHRLEKYSLVYLVKDGAKVQQIVLPVRGKGLWSTMFAYVALDGDLTTIRGISFYEHGETPGLGGEVENSRWQDGWRGKRVYDDDGKIGMSVVKGKAATEEPAKHFQIDGLSGATLTTKGVNNLMEFWFGEHGFKPFLSEQKKEQGSLQQG
ncbi:MAG: Na(+)-translocating NADH-quinone reductase subunit C [Proteobacteria bacterium]|nr:Na(+)-translocating NADH-quinone reductase subunit C [Pseudomonadota bacterium]